MIRVVTGFIGRVIDREFRSASKVVWESARAATYAPFVVSTILMLMHRLDAEHWTAVTIATIAADGAKNTAESFFEGVKGVVGKIASVWSGDTSSDDNDED